MSMGQDLFFAQKALTLLFSTTNKLQMKGDKYLQDITLRQMLAIPSIIHAPDGKATINHIAKNLGTTKQNTKQIVDAMARKGYLSIAPSEQDRRALNITITPEGWQAFKSCSARTDEFLADIFHDFTSQELQTFSSLLEKLYGFDGIKPDALTNHADYNEEDAGEALKHHPLFLKRKKNHHRKEQ